MQSPHNPYDYGTSGYGGGTPTAEAHYGFHHKQGVYLPPWQEFTPQQRFAEPEPTPSPAPAPPPPPTYVPRQRMEHQMGHQAFPPQPQAHVLPPAPPPQPPMVAYLPSPPLGPMDSPEYATDGLYASPDPAHGEHVMAWGTPMGRGHVHAHFNPNGAQHYATPGGVPFPPSPPKKAHHSSAAKKHHGHGARQTVRGTLPQPAFADRATDLQQLPNVHGPATPMRQPSLLSPNGNAHTNYSADGGRVSASAVPPPSTPERLPSERPRPRPPATPPQQRQHPPQPQYHHTTDGAPRVASTPTRTPKQRQRTTPQVTPASSAKSRGTKTPTRNDATDLLVAQAESLVVDDDGRMDTSPVKHKFAPMATDMEVLPLWIDDTPAGNERRVECRVSPEHPTTAQPRYAQLSPVLFIKGGVYTVRFTYYPPPPGTVVDGCADKLQFVALMVSHQSQAKQKIPCTLAPCSYTLRLDFTERVATITEDVAEGADTQTGLCPGKVIPLASLWKRHTQVATVFFQLQLPGASLQLHDVTHTPGPPPVLSPPPKKAPAPSAGTVPTP